MSALTFQAKARKRPSAAGGTVNAIEWSRKATVKRTSLTVSKHYRSLCGDWELVEVRWLHTDGYGHYWLAIKHFGARRTTRHKTRQAAQAALYERRVPPCHA